MVDPERSCGSSNAALAAGPPTGYCIWCPVQQLFLESTIGMGLASQVDAGCPRSAPYRAGIEKSGSSVGDPNGSIHSTTCLQCTNTGGCLLPILSGFPACWTKRLLSNEILSGEDLSSIDKQLTHPLWRTWHLAFVGGATPCGPRMEAQRLGEVGQPRNSQDFKHSVSPITEISGKSGWEANKTGRPILSISLPQASSFRVSTFAQPSRFGSRRPTHHLIR